MNKPVMRNKFTSAQIPAKEERHEDKLAKGAMLAERNVPTMIPGIRVATTVLDPSLPTIAAIDKYWRVYWSPRGVDWMIRAAEAVSVQHPCTACGTTSHNKYSYLAGLWIHEIGHCVFRHHDRMEEGGFLDFQKWNIATDLEMNDDIPVMGRQAQQNASQFSDTGLCPAMCLPKHVMVDPNLYDIWMHVGSAAFKQMTGKDMWDLFHPVGAHQPGMVRVPFGMYPDQTPGAKPGEYITLPDGKIAEMYYDLIPSPPPEEDENQGKGEGQGQEGEGEGQGSGEGEGEGQGQGEGNNSGNSNSKSKGKSKKSTKGLDELNDHGSGSGGEQRPWEQGKPGEGGNAPGVCAAEAQAVRRQVATKIKEASNGRGNTPAGWEVWADTQLQPPKVRWQDRLKAVARQAIVRVRGDKNTTYRRLSRQSIVSNCAVIKPNTYDVVPTVVVVCDTSGSMGSGSASRLERALSECESIIKSQKVHALFLDCDANVYGKAQEIKSLRTAKVSGGGGTDMRVGVLAAKNTKPKPDIIVLLTDGDTPWPTAGDVQGIKVITGICNESDRMSSVPPWMNPIWVDSDK